MITSVHLQNFPNLNSIVVDKIIIDKMDKVREICNCVFSLRKEANIRVRRPLKKITICGDVNLDSEYLDLIKQEVNTREIELFNGDFNEIATKEVVLNMKECGALFGKKLKDILVAQKNRQWEIIDKKLHIADVEIDENLFDIVYCSKDGTKISSCAHFNILVMIDTEENRDLIIEGLARDVTRIIQQTRKDIGLEISDRINVVIHTKDVIFTDVMSLWKDYICEQTLALNIDVKNEQNSTDLIELDGYKFSVTLTKVS